jgi:A/G-specific adenine glycosylase
MALWPTVDDLAAADDADVMGEWAGLGYYARARNLLKCARVVAGELGGVFPDTLDGLRALPGVGPYTAAAIAAIAFDRPEAVVDGNVERVMARLFRVETPLPGAKPALRARAAEMTPHGRPGDYAQAVMDLGATICTPTSPACGICPWRGECRARAVGVQASLPARAPKVAKPVRRGIAYVARRGDGAWLLERRPDTGLLGGMLGWPGGAWGAEPEDLPPVTAPWRTLPAEVRHTFTHFHLHLEVRIATLPVDCQPERGAFVPALRLTDLPTVMRKAFDLAGDAFETP